MADVPWWERAWPNLEALRRQLEPVQELVARMDTPGLRALQATLADLELAHTPEGQAVLAERREEHRRAELATAAAVAAQELEQLTTFVEPRAWRPRLPAAHPDDSDDPATLLQQREAAARLQAALGDLTAEEREFLALVTTTPHCEVAQRYGVKVKTVAQRAWRLRRKLRARMPDV
jgi:DNA-directed RNA polymerase specialized sigma24 family protein